MKLLVSVADAHEARVAVRGGVDIVDVKNPAEGALGAPAPATIAQVRDTVPPERPVSAAIGDLPDLPGTAALAALGAAHSGAAYVKVGLWGTSTEDEAVAVLRAVREAVDGGPTVIAAAYADAERVPSRPLAPRSCGRRGARAPGSVAAWSTRPSRTVAGSSHGSRRTCSRRWSPRRTPPTSRWRWPGRCAPRTYPRCGRQERTSRACARPPATTAGAPRPSTRSASSGGARCARARPRDHERPGGAAAL